ncbi:ERIC3 protein, partial [Vireo altiloquus]|nr:ERIC3 protein [Vireo altiloquus]
GISVHFLLQNSRGFPKSPLCSNALVTMMYLGKSKNVCLSYYKEEIRVDQQHCGSENICVYKGELMEGDTFQFISKRHQGFPFSLTFYLNGMQIERLSCCCEYKHQRRARLQRGRRSYFRVVYVEGAFPCYKCLIAMGLDKKLLPPKRKIKYREKHVCCCDHPVHCEPSTSTLELKSCINSELDILPSHEVSLETVEEALETGEQYRNEE